MAVTTGLSPDSGEVQIKHSNLDVSVPPESNALGKSGTIWPWNMLAEENIQERRKFESGARESAIIRAAAALISAEIVSAADGHFAFPSWLYALPGSAIPRHSSTGIGTHALIS